jgi:hypothetical protein
MKKLNGTILFERDYIGEIPEIHHGESLSKEVSRACNVFFARRGMRPVSVREMIRNQAMTRLRGKAMQRRREFLAEEEEAR